MSNGLEAITVLLSAKAPDYSAMGAAVALLRRPRPDLEISSIDAHARLHRELLDNIESAIRNLPEEAQAALAATRQGWSWSSVFPTDGEDAHLDSVALLLYGLLHHWGETSTELAVAVCRLIEDSERIQNRKQRSLGVGFEGLLRERLQRRFAILFRAPEYIDALEKHKQLLLEEPSQGVVALTSELHIPPNDELRLWIEAERKVGMLHCIRRHKTHEGHIHSYIRRDVDAGPVLERYGAQGHWIIIGRASSQELVNIGVASERVYTSTAQIAPEAWRAVIYGENDHRRATIDAAQELLDAPKIEFGLRLPRMASIHANRRLALRAWVRSELVKSARRSFGDDIFGILAQALKKGRRRKTPIKKIPRFSLSLDREHVRLAAHLERKSVEMATLDVDCSECDLLAFLATLDRCCDIGVQLNEFPVELIELPSVASVVALIRHRQAAGGIGGDKRRKRAVIVYFPSEIPHELGGFPQVGAAFICDRLQEAGFIADHLTIDAKDFTRYVPQLMGAEVIGFSAYIHNQELIAAAIQQIRRAGYPGFIILGGPELCDINEILANTSGWDAAIRGEGEEAVVPVIEVLEEFRTGYWPAALKNARRLKGVALRVGETVLLCDTQAKNRAHLIQCPLPIGFQQAKGRTLKMNFTRGCPYQCTFCPNHQGRRIAAGPDERIWQFAIQAVAENFQLPREIEERFVAAICEVLGLSGSVPLSIALELVWRCGTWQPVLEKLLAVSRDAVSGQFLDNAQVIGQVLGIADCASDRLSQLKSVRGGLSEYQLAWLLIKMAFLAEEKANPHFSQDFAQACEGEPFFIETSEDNTLVNRDVVVEFLRRRKAFGLAREFVFNPGQNSIKDLLDRHGHGADEQYVEALASENPFRIALGTDGSSNSVLRQNGKPEYGVSDILAVNKALGIRGIEVANNYILLGAETDLIEAVEAFLLFLLMPIPWRDYKQSINLRVIKEVGTLATDEGLLYAPDDEGHDVPFRNREVQALIDRWQLTARVPTGEVHMLLRRILRSDPEVARGSRLST